MKLNVREIVVFGVFGALMFATKIAMEGLPNIHLLAVFIVALTVVYRFKALYPIYVFVLILGVYYGFATWWFAHLYIWLPLWGAAMIIPKKLPKIPQMLVYMGIAALHGFLYGTLWAPFQALMYGLTFEGTITWIIAGLPWDGIHGVSNLICGLLIYPMIELIKKIKPVGYEGRKITRGLK